jgi:hypothetical protein
VNSEFRELVVPFLTRAQGGNFEKEMATFVESVGPREFATLNRLVAFAMLTGRGCRFPRCPQGDLYDELLRLNGCPRQKLLVVTFNYDVLLEEAATRVAGRPDHSNVLSYPGLKLVNQEDRVLSVFKPHGSVNWIAVDNHKGASATASAIRVTPAAFAGKLAGLATNQEYVPPAGREENVKYLKRQPAPQPVLAFYMDGKPAPRNEPSVERHRRACLDALRQESDLPITVIGLCPPRRDGNDDFLQELFELIRVRSAPKEYVSPSAEDCGVAKAYGLDVVDGGLREYIAARRVE